MPKESYAIRIKRILVRYPCDIVENYDNLIENEAYEIITFNSRTAAIKYAKEYLLGLIASETDMNAMLGEINDFTNDNQHLLFTFSLYYKDNKRRIVNYEISLKHAAKHGVR